MVALALENLSAVGLLVICFVQQVLFLLCLWKRSAPAYKWSTVFCCVGYIVLSVIYTMTSSNIEQLYTTLVPASALMLFHVMLYPVVEHRL